MCQFRNSEKALSCRPKRNVASSSRRYATNARVHHIPLMAVGCLILVLLSGCGSSNKFRNSAAVTVAYDVPRADLITAYRNAFRTLPAISHEAYGDTLIVGASRDATFPADIQIRFSADGSMTVVDAGFQYDIINEFRHYPMMLVSAVKEALPEGAGAYRPQVVYPSDSVRCDVPPPPKNARVVPPELIGGKAALARQVFYPPDAKKSGVGGAVYAGFVVGTRNRAVCVEILSGLPVGINAQVIGALLALDFRPGTVDGVPTPMRVEMPLTFSSQQR